MSTEKTTIKTTLLAPFDLWDVAFFPLVGLVIFLCVAVGICICWMWMALRAIASAILNSWQRLLNSGYGWSKRQKTLLPRSDYGWKPNL